MCVGAGCNFDCSNWSMEGLTEASIRSGIYAE